MIGSLKKFASTLLAMPAVRFAVSYERLTSLLLGRRIDGIVRGRVIDALSSPIRTATHRGVTLQFACPNQLTAYRARSFSDKEPETLEWIDSFEDGAVLWDIGANVGLYSIYAAKRHKRLRVYAFEPSVLNLELLARNVALNDVGEQVCIVSLPLFARTGEDRFILSTLQHGGALSAFGVNYGHDGKPMAPQLAYRTLGVSLDDLVSHLGIAPPNFIKMDVDGVEHLILRGGAQTLSKPTLRSMLVELNGAFQEQIDGATSLLCGAGLRLAAKRRSEPLGVHNDFAETFNYIWARDAVLKQSTGVIG